MLCCSGDLIICDNIQIITLLHAVGTDVLILVIVGGILETSRHTSHVRCETHLVKFSCKKLFI